MNPIGPIDIAALEARIVEGLQNDHSWPFDGKVRGDAFAALDALVSEVERLRAQVDDYRMMIDGLESAAHEERAAVVAMLRAEARAVGASPDERRVLNAVARCIERGEHRKKGEP
jgi:hypothetical protein